METIQMFTMETNGTLRTAMEFDYESYQTLSIRVKAFDPSNESVEGAFSVHVTDVEETTPNQLPVGLNHLSSLSIAENEVQGTIVGTFQAQDPDGDSLTYHLISGAGDGNNSMFTMDANGTLRTAMEFDYESYQTLKVRVAAMDQLNGSVEGSFIVNVNDVVESIPNQPPLGLDHLGILIVSENKPSGTIVGSFGAQDPDGDSLTYNLVSGVGEGNNTMFTMDANGTLRTAMEFDYESYQTLNVRVAVMDNDNGSVEGVFTVIISDINEDLQNSPPINLYEIDSLQIMENQPVGTFVGEFNASDPDGDPLTFELVSGDGDINNQMFEFDENGSLRTTQVFDYESNIVLSVRVGVRDDKNGRISKSFVVKVIDLTEQSTNQPPVDLKSKEDLLVSENQPSGTIVGQFEAVDPEGGMLSFFLLFDEEINDNDLFVLETNGTLKTIAELNFENKSSLKINVGVQDSSNAFISSSFEVKVIDENETEVNRKPRDLRTLEKLSVVENEQVGTLVGEFNATDPEGGNLFYFLTSGIGDDDIDKFYILGNELRTKAVFEFSKVNQLNIRVGVMDESSSNTDANFTISVLEKSLPTTNLPPFGLEPVSQLVFSNYTQVGDIIGEFNSTDPGGGVLFYNLSPNLIDNDNGMFSISENRFLILENKISFEYNATFSIEMNVRDETNGSSTETFIVEYNFLKSDSSVLPFYFTSTHLSVEENKPIGTLVGNFYATSGVVSGETVEYTLKTGGEEFILDKNGTLRTNLIFDFEKLNQEEIMIEVIGNTSNKQVTVRKFLVVIIDHDEKITESSPYNFNLTKLHVAEDAVIGSVVGSFFPVDGSGPGNVLYILSDPNSLFAIQDDKLVTRIALDYNNVAYYNLEIDVLATIDSQIVNSRSFQISLDDVNYAPESVYTEDELHILNDQKESFLIGPFLVVDKDVTDEHIIELIDTNKSNHNHLFTAEQNGMLRFRGGDTLGNYEKLSIHLKAIDEQGLYLEQVFEIKYERSVGDAVTMLSDGFDVGGGWKRAGWFGQFFSNYYPWIYHENLGWIYVEQKNDQNMWFYCDELGWIWTNPECFPYLFLVERAEWFYINRKLFPAFLYDYKYGEWFNIEKLYEVSAVVKNSVGGKVMGAGTYGRWETARITAIPEDGFEFIGWKGDIELSDHEIELEVHRNFHFEAEFKPNINPTINTAESLKIILKYVDSLEYLSVEEKQQAISNLFFYGKI